MRRRTFTFRGAIAGLAIVAACGGAGEPSPEADRTTSTLLPNAATLIPGGNIPAQSPGSTTSAGQPRRTPAASSTVPGASPSPIDIGPAPVPVQAAITPACVIRGGSATITVQTEPKAGVAYHAVYAGTKGGAVPPYGYGYGGNDKGFANDEGRYTSRWVVRVDAPVGPARADVVVGNGDEFGYDDPPFYVAASEAGCPS